MRTLSVLLKHGNRSFAHLKCLLLIATLLKADQHKPRGLVTVYKSFSTLGKPSPYPCARGEGPL